MTSAWLYILQRASAMIMAPLVIAHLLLIIYAMRGGITAGEILSRTQGSVGWAIFYGLFVVSAAIHAPIGVRNVLAEMAGLKGRAVDLLMAGFAVLLLIIGLRAVYGVVAI
ncbi:succinate dehydrogenase [Alphaproteobacteria bacterium HT1-32]|mgnify:FL=1|nr:succinate dehydrogenase [Alphaproteobacteria bacterium HT1-32]|tara:strand:+ start:29998 stop:30330 length:333 start_codon:yes stop_codon:yes gene_type:complete